MSLEFEEHKVYVLLDFQGTETGLSNHESEYFRMLNLNETKPIVQLGEDIYEGTYEDALGTNVFFEESEDDRQNTNIFESKSPICLKYKLQQTKILHLKKIGTRQKNSYKMNPSEAVNIQIPENYKELLEQYSAGTLNIENYLIEKESNNKSGEESKTVREQHQSNILAWYNEDCVTNEEDSSIIPQELRQGSTSTFTKKSDSLHEKYLNLEKLVQEPIKHYSVENYLSEKSIFSTSKAEFTNWKNHLLKNLGDYPIKLDIKKDNMGDFVDIENSIASGIIAQSNESPRAFSKEEKQKLLSFDNFVNASPFFKLLMLKDYLRMFKSLIDKMIATELNKKVPDSFSILEKYKALQDFKKEFKSSIMLRLQSINENEDVQSTLKLKVSEEKDFSDVDDTYDSEWENSLSDNEEEII